MRIAGALILCGQVVSGAAAMENPARACHVAKPCKRPVGAPGASDVLMRTLRMRPTGEKDPHDTLQAIRDFHVTRLEWAYISDKPSIEKIKALGCLFGAAASAPSYLPPEDDTDWFEKVVIVDREGKPIIAPWKRTWKRTLWGCINNPELERGYVAYLKRAVDTGAKVIQRDEPGCNLNATRWGGCFCPHCMKGFREFLRKNTTPEKRRGLGIDDLESFDYRKHLAKQKAPVGDAFGRFKGGELKSLFVRFQTEATIAFHQRTRKALNDYAGRRVPMSCNNGAHRWGPIQLEFDWAFGEFSYGHARPEYLLQAMRTAARHNRIQVVTMPKKGNYDNPEAWQRRTRQTIAMTYACGGLCMVPWDVFMPSNAPRYFGTPEQYADLFGFIRGAAEYLDGYEEAAVAGRGMKETRYGNAPPLSITGGNGQLCAILRAKPGDEKAPVVVHLIDWGDRPEPFTVKLRRAAVFGSNSFSVKLLVPAKYGKRTHETAEETTDFSPLIRTIDLAVEAEGGYAKMNIPVVKPWGVLVVEQ